MTGGGEFGDPRDHRPGDDGCDGSCEQQRDDSGWVQPDHYVETLMALADEPVDPAALDLAVDLDGRWPEPRVFWQTEVFYTPARDEIVIGNLDAEQAGMLLDAMVETVGCLHGAAVRDERLTTSSGAARLLAGLGVPATEDLDPLTWLEGTVLVRRLRAIARASP